MKLSDQKPVSIHRRKETDKPKVMFHVFGEGAKTEPTYLAGFLNSLGEVPFEFHITAPVGVAKTVVAKACEFKDKLLKQLEVGQSLSDTDRFWVVFDCDGNAKDYSDAISDGIKNGISVACSNPCFELWIVLHFEVYDKPSSQREVQKRLSELCPNYHHVNNKTVDFRILQDRVPTAEQRAADLQRRRKADGASCPETSFGNLTSALRSEAKPLRRGRPSELEGIKPVSLPAKRHNKKKAKL